MRPRKCIVQKSIDKAAVLYWKWQEMLNTSEDDVAAARQGNKKMGRPPVPLAELRKRAENAYKTEVTILRSLEATQGKVPVSESDLIARGEALRTNGPGRPAITDIGLKHRHLRRKLKHLEEAQKAIDIGDGADIPLGRTAMSVADRVNHYTREIELVKAEIDVEVMKLSDVDRLKLLLDNALIDQRDLKIKLKSASRKDKPHIEDLLKRTKTEVDLLAEMHKTECEFIATTNA